ncbi:hypothetical protein AQB9606_03445 [Aquabacterium sp. CECT 9606]|nr:hypothetical protein AQB9606_03445 [Aquabacterium sp. CECT 9606]
MPLSTRNTLNEIVEQDFAKSAEEENNRDFALLVILPTVRRQLRVK